MDLSISFFSEKFVFKICDEFQYYIIPAVLLLYFIFISFTRWFHIAGSFSISQIRSFVFTSSIMFAIVQDYKPASFILYHASIMGWWVSVSRKSREEGSGGAHRLLRV